MPSKALRNTSAKPVKKEEALLLAMSNDFEKGHGFPLLPLKSPPSTGKKPAKTVLREISAAEKRGPAETKGDLTRARIGTILAFLPLSKPEALPSP